MIKSIENFTIPIDELPVWAFNIKDMNIGEFSLKKEKLPNNVNIDNYYPWNPYHSCGKNFRFTSHVLLDYVKVCITEYEDDLEKYGFYKLKIDKDTKDITWVKLKCITCDCYPPSNECGECPVWLSDSEEYYG